MIDISGEPNVIGKMKGKRKRGRLRRSEDLMQRKSNSNVGLKNRANKSYAAKITCVFHKQLILKEQLTWQKKLILPRWRGRIRREVSQLYYIRFLQEYNNSYWMCLLQVASLVFEHGSVLSPTTEHEHIHKLQKIIITFFIKKKLLHI